MKGIDLFCGAGGSSWGAKTAGIEIVAGFDIWQQAGEVYQANFPEARFYPGDLSAYSHTDILRIKKEIGEIDLILASPECTGHSLAKGAKTPNPQSINQPWVVLRFADVFLPRWMVIENVSSMRNWSDYPMFLECLKKKGYKLLEQILNADQFGVPQSRKRLFILCDKETNPPEIIPSCRQPIPVRSILNFDKHRFYSPLERPGRAQKTLERAQRAFEALGKNTAFLLVYYGSGKPWQSLDEPLRTVTTNNHFALVLPDEKRKHVMRMLQPDELQAAMGFPPEFKFENHLTKKTKMRLLGNAVCPPVMTAIVQALTRKNENRLY